jgi:RNA polymerase sigma-70 factor (ECF subfamily)
MMDESTFASFYEKTKRSLWLYVAKMVNDESNADDIFQESYVRFLQSRVDLENEVQMKSYLYRIATNLVHDSWRRQKRERRWLTSQANEVTTRSGGSDVELRTDLSNALMELAPRQRSIVVLTYVEEYTHKEIAAILNLRETSVKVLLHRAKRRLLEIFKRTGITSENAS